MKPSLKATISVPANQINIYWTSPGPPYETNMLRLDQWSSAANLDGTLTIQSLVELTDDAFLSVQILRSPRPIEQGHTKVLNDYADAKLISVSNNGTTVNIGTTDAPVIVSTDTNADGKSDVLGLLMQAQLSESSSWPWYQSSGTVIINEAQLKTIANAVSAHRAAAFAAWQAVAGGINTGTITTTAQIDAAFAPMLA